MYLKRLKELRDKNNMTQSQVAEELGISQQQYSRYEMGQYSIPLEMLKKLCKLYDVSSDYIIDLTNDPRHY